MQAASAAHFPACRLLGQLYGLSSNSFSTLSDRERISKSPSSSSSSSSHVSNEVPLFSTCSAPSPSLAYCISWSEKTLMAFISGVVYVFLIDCITFLFFVLRLLTGMQPQELFLYGFCSLGQDFISQRLSFRCRYTYLEQTVL